MRRTRSELVKISLAAVFMCLYVILNRFVSVYLPLGGVTSVRIGFSSIPIVFASLICGPIWGALAGAGGDLIGAFGFPNGTGAYLYGYTIDQALLGMIPWILMKLFRGRRKILSVFDLAVTLACGGLLSWVVSADDSSSAGYSIPLDTGGRIGLVVGAVALVLIVSAITVYFGDREETTDNALDKSVSMALSKRMSKLESEGRSDKEILRTIRRESRRLIDGSLTYSVLYGITDASKSRETGRKILGSTSSSKRLRKVASGGDTLHPAYSFLDIYSIYLFEMLTVKTLLLAYWSELYYGIPYSYGVFTDLLTGIVTLPILALITYAVMVPLSSTGMFDLGRKASTYAAAKRAVEE